MSSTPSYLFPKITVVTACYNRVDTIRDTIESVLMQDYSGEVEYIIVDGASTDGTSEIIAEYSDRVARIISEPDHGMYEALNKGLRLATGDVVGWVHSDDVLFDAHTLSAIAEAFITDTNFVYADGLFVDNKTPNRVVRNWIGGRHSTWRVRHGWLPLHPTCYVRRDYLEEVGFYDESFTIAADTEWLLRALLHPELHIGYLDRYVIRMRMGGLSTDLSHRRLMWQEDLRAYAMHGLPPRRTKLMKMMWKIPQFITARLKRL